MAYCETSKHTDMMSYMCFSHKLKKIQSIVQKINFNDFDENINLQSFQTNTKCKKCDNIFFYKFGNIIWPKTLLHKINDHQLYPSEYFIKIIMGCCIINDNIVNPPIQIKPKLINLFRYIPFHRNKLLILDALMYQGSHPIYSTTNGKYIYSEHSGVISLKNHVIDNIIVSAETNRINTNDENIYLPINTKNMNEYEYLFHTHPNTITYAGRINNGIIYEFPSVNDILNFLKYRYTGKTQASIIIAPEGTYVIRPLIYTKIIRPNNVEFYKFQDFILKLESNAIEYYRPHINRLSEPDFFHINIGSNMIYITEYNKFIKHLNLFVEYYPREKINGEWRLRPFNLFYIGE